MDTKNSGCACGGLDIIITHREIGDQFYHKSQRSFVNDCYLSVLIRRHTRKYYSKGQPQYIKRLNGHLKRNHWMRYRCVLVLSCIYLVTFQYSQFLNKFLCRPSHHLMQVIPSGIRAPNLHHMWIFNQQKDNASVRLAR